MRHTEFGDSQDSPLLFPNRVRLKSHPIGKKRSKNIFRALFWY